MGSKNKNRMLREILAVLDFDVTIEEIKNIFGFNNDEVFEFLRTSKNYYSIDHNGKYHFKSDDDFSFFNSIPQCVFLIPLYLFWKEKGVDVKTINETRTKLRGLNTGKLADYINLALEVGDYAASISDTVFSAHLYNSVATISKELPIAIRKPYFIGAVLKLSKIEFMRGSSQQDTLNLQREALSLITEANISSNDALLYLYAGVNEHFGGLMEKGALLRKKGIEALQKFNYPGLQEEAAPLLVWDYYLTGDLRRTIAYYESVILPLECKNEKEIFSFIYPPVIFSYFFIGENNRALILAQRIYKRAVDNNDKMVAVLIRAIMGRVYVYMNDLDTAPKILYSAYEDALEMDYGWALYYALFGIAFYHMKCGRLKESRDALAEAITNAQDHGFAPINASPFILDILKAVKDNGFERIEGFDYDDKLSSYTSSKNIHMSGVAYRHIALKEKKLGKQIDSVINKLEKSVQLLEESGDPHELALSAIALSKEYLDSGNHNQTKKYANLAWSHLEEKDYSEFPAELVQYVDAEMKVSILEALLDTHWLELRHIVNMEQLSIRLLTNLCRDMRMECGAFFYFDGVSAQIQCTQNIENIPVDNPQFLRAEAIAIAVANSQKIFVNFDERHQPMMSIGIPFVYDSQAVAVIYMESSLEYKKITEEECSLLSAFASKMSETIVTAMTYTGIILTDDSDSTIEFAETMGTASEYCKSLDENVRFIREQISKVAGTNVPVLITGETGVGKEVFAREVFNNSNYKKAFIKVNCGAIPNNLIESELFGYEKGSFTGASRTKKGYFEVAENGTVFLDEIGELPLSAQVKLLRVLQEHEFMRVGGTESVKANFRLIAATNKDLNLEVEKGNFRGDLFYRLNVIKLQVPALRERKKDIPVLINFFIDKYSREFGKKCKAIESQSLIEMLNYPWPGNIRELENIIQKAVLLSDGNLIHVELPDTNPIITDDSAYTPEGQSKTSIRKGLSVRDYLENGEILPLAEMEAQYIQTVLHLCNGKISGKGGAAEALGMKRTTLISRMKKLGIQDKN